MTWPQFWKIILLFTLFGYSALVIVVAIGGFMNVVEMLRELSPKKDPAVPQSKSMQDSADR